MQMRVEPCGVMLLKESMESTRVWGTCDVREVWNRVVETDKEVVPAGEKQIVL